MSVHPRIVTKVRVELVIQTRGARLFGQLYNNSTIQKAHKNSSFGTRYVCTWKYPIDVFIATYQKTIYVLYGVCVRSP